MRNNWPGLLGLILLAAGAGVGTFFLVAAQADPAPLGVPVPVVEPIYELLPQDATAETSVIAKRIPKQILQLLVDQPDGSPPLRYGIKCDIADFYIRHPFGAQTQAFDYEDVKQHGTLIEAEILFDQPVKALQYSAIARQDNETVSGYVERLRGTLAEKGAEFFPDTTPLEIDDYRFEHFEYERESEDGSILSHYLFIGPLGPHRVLVMNFMTVPKLHDLARPQVWKVMHSFIPGWQLSEMAVAERDGVPDAGIAGNDATE